jgi:hypothetical protein
MRRTPFTLPRRPVIYLAAVPTYLVSCDRSRRTLRRASVAVSRADISMGPIDAMTSFVGLATSLQTATHFGSL